LGYGVAGGVGGFALAAVCILLISTFVAGQGNRTGEVRAGDLFKFQAYLLLFTFVLNLLQKVDLILIKALSSTDAAVASKNAAYYSAAINVANITYQIIISIAFVIFPLISHVTFVNDRPRAQVYISNALRYTLIIMALTASLFSANAGEVLRVIYPGDYQAGSDALAIVAFGMLFFGLLYVITTIISASGRPTVSLMIGAATLATSAALNAALIPALGLRGAAIGTTAAMLFGAIAGGAYLLVKFGALILPLSLARITASSALVYLASLLFTPTSRVLIVIKLAGLSLLYLVSLVVSKEVGRSELEMLKKVLKK
jgi:O-antigen/teichoic acid export membrane protein